MRISQILIFRIVYEHEETSIIGLGPISGIGVYLTLLLASDMIMKTVLVDNSNNCLTCSGRSSIGLLSHHRSAIFYCGKFYSGICSIHKGKSPIVPHVTPLHCTSNIEFHQFCFLFRFSFKEIEIKNNFVSCTNTLNSFLYIGNCISCLLTR